MRQATGRSLAAGVCVLAVAGMAALAAWLIPGSPYQAEAAVPGSAAASCVPASVESNAGVLGADPGTQSLTVTGLGGVSPFGESCRVDCAGADLLEYTDGTKSHRVLFSELFYGDSLYIELADDPAPDADGVLSARASVVILCRRASLYDYVSGYTYRQTPDEGAVYIDNRFGAKVCWPQQPLDPAGFSVTLPDLYFRGNAVAPAYGEQTLTLQLYTNGGWATVPEDGAPPSTATVAAGPDSSARRSPAQEGTARAFQFQDGMYGTLYLLKRDGRVYGAAVRPDVDGVVAFDFSQADYANDDAYALLTALLKSLAPTANEQ